MKRILEFLIIHSQNPPHCGPKNQMEKICLDKALCTRTLKMYSSLISGVKYKWKTSWIDDAIKQLGEIDEEIAEEGFPPINDNAKKTAKKILNILNLEGMEYAPFCLSYYGGRN